MTQTVLVTGANGHLGNTLVKALLARGYRVRATVRDPADTQRRGIFAGADVELCTADIRDADALRTAMTGVSGVFQVAALYHYQDRGHDEGIVRNNTEGSTTVLNVAADLGVKRIIMTSSIAAVGFGGTAAEPMDERSWSDPQDPYCLSKMESERMAWQLADVRQLELVTLCPGLVLGPNFYKHTASTANVAAYINNQVPFRVPLQTSVVDVRDVAEAHILAFESRITTGRFLVSGHHVEDFCEILSRYDREMLLPSRVLSLAEAKIFAEKSGAPVEMIGSSFRYTDQKAKHELGWTPRPLAETMTDTIDWIKSRHM